MRSSSASYALIMDSLLLFEDKRRRGGEVDMIVQSKRFNAFPFAFAPKMTPSHSQISEVSRTTNSSLYVAILLCMYKINIYLLQRDHC